MVLPTPPESVSYQIFSRDHSQARPLLLDVPQGPALSSRRPHNLQGVSMQALLLTAEAHNGYLYPIAAYPTSATELSEYFRRAPTSIMDVNEKLAEQVIASRLAGAELAQRLADTETLNKGLAEEIERMQRDLKQAERDVTGLIAAAQKTLYEESAIMPFGQTNFFDRRADIPATPVDYISVPSSRHRFLNGVVPVSMSPIEQCLNSQRALCALNREKVHSENLFCELQERESSLAASHARNDELAAENQAAQITLTEAQWGVLKYHDKCDRQRRQLSDVQSANANLKKENAKLREEVKRLRKGKKELVGGSVDKDKAWRESWRRRRNPNSVDIEGVGFWSNERPSPASVTTTEASEHASNPSRSELVLNAHLDLDVGIEDLLELGEKTSLRLLQKGPDNLWIVAPNPTFTVRHEQSEDLAVGGHVKASDDGEDGLFDDTECLNQGCRFSSEHSGGLTGECKLAASSQV